jgi:hypothetical protein
MVTNWFCILRLLRNTSQNVPKNGQDYAGQMA